MIRMICKKDIVVVVFFVVVVVVVLLLFFLVERLLVMFNTEATVTNIQNICFLKYLKQFPCTMSDYLSPLYVGGQNYIGMFS